MSTDFKPTPAYKNPRELFRPHFADAIVKHSVLRDIASMMPGKSINAQCSRIYHALMYYPLTEHEVTNFLECDQPEKSINRLSEITRHLAIVRFPVTDENGHSHMMTAYTFHPERHIGWEIFGRYMEPAALALAMYDAQQNANAVKAAQAAKDNVGA